MGLARSAASLPANVDAQLCLVVTNPVIVHLDHGKESNCRKRLLRQLQLDNLTHLCVESALHSDQELAQKVELGFKCHSIVDLVSAAAGQEELDSVDEVLLAKGLEEQDEVVGGPQHGQTVSFAVAEGDA